MAHGDFGICDSCCVYCFVCLLDLLMRQRHISGVGGTIKLYSLLPTDCVLRCVMNSTAINAISLVRYILRALWNINPF